MMLFGGGLEKFNLGYGWLCSRGRVVQGTRKAPDEGIVNAFLKNAGEIFEVACAAGGGDCDWNIVVDHSGGIQMTSGDWQAERLREARGAEAAYRVKRNGGRVRVEASRAGEKCVLAYGGASALAGQLNDFPRYLLA